MTAKPVTLKEIRLWKEPVEFASCMNCPSLTDVKESGTKEIPLKLRCGEFPKEEKEISIDMMLSAGKATFPDFCPMENTGKINEYGLQIRIYNNVTPIYCCLNCPAFQSDREQTPVVCACGRTFDEDNEKLRRITVDMDLYNKFPDFCPLDKILVAAFKKERGF